MEHSSNSPSCEACRSYRSKSASVMHNHEKHKRGSNIDTFLCEKSAPELYGCAYCERKMDLKVNLEEHLRLSHGKGGGVCDFQGVLESYVCEDCKFETYSLLVLSRHITTSECMNCTVKLEKKYIVKQFKFKCKHCDHEFSNTPLLKAHIKKKHGEYRPAPVKCKFCDFDAKNVFLLKRHFEQKHTPAIADDTKWMECQFCSFKAKNSRVLEAHTKCSHMGWLECQHCYLKTRSRSALTGHIKTRHTTAENINSMEHSYFKMITKTATISSNKSREDMHWSEHNYFKVTRNTGQDVGSIFREDVTWYHCRYCDFKTKDADGIPVHWKSTHK